MPTLELLFIIIIAIIVVSVVLSVIDWIYLASLSSKTALLEREVEKKSMEFDTLKKERAGTRQSSMSTASVIESSEPLAGDDATPQQQPSIEDTIQIVRNVRGNFERTNHFTHDISPYPPDTAAGASPPPSPIGPNAVPAAPVGIAAAITPEARPVQAQPRVAPPNYPGNDHFITTAADTGNSTTLQTEQYVLKLYSDATRDADFQVLWHTITSVFQTCAQPRILVDLTGINFMYDKEMDYLEKIKYLLAGRGGTFGFINCDRELLTLFNNRPQLKSIVQ